MAVYRVNCTFTFLLAFILVMLKFQVLVVAASELIGVVGEVLSFISQNVFTLSLYCIL
jgi:hypothetical protein